MRSLMLTVLVAALVVPAHADEAKERRKKLAQVVALDDQRSMTSALSALSKDADAEIRAAAVRAIGRIQDAGGRDEIRAALKDAEPSVRAEAAFAAGQMEGMVADVLARFEAEKDPLVRQRLVEAVGKAGDGRHARWLAERGDDPDVRVRIAAITGLGLVARRLEGELPDVLAEQLAKWVGDEDKDVRYAAGYVLMRAKSKTGDAAFDAARTCAGDGAPTVRAVCVRALANFGERAGPVLEGMTEDTGWRVRVEVARSLGKLGRDEGLLKMLSWATEEAKAERLATDSPDLHPVLVALDEALKRPSTKALVAAGEAIFKALKVKGKIADAEGAGRTLGNSHVACRAAALWERGSGKPSRVRRCGAADYPAAYREPFEVAVLTGLSGGRRNKALSTFFAKATPQGKVAVLGAVEAGGSVALELATRAAADSDGLVVSEAAAMARRLELDGAAGPLMLAYRRFMAAKQYEVVQSIFEALGELNAGAAANVLEEHVFHPNRGVARAAEQALKKIRGHNAKASRGLPSLQSPLTSDPSPALADPSPYRKAVLHTSKGAFTIELLAEDARNTVKNFVRLVERGYYDGLKFHRVVPDFVAQGGDPQGDGMGGPGYAIRCEINAHRYGTGAVGMALAGKDTGGSQFFVTHSPQPHLDGGYTIFGNVVEGQDVVDALTVGDRLVRVELKRPDEAEKKAE